MSVKKKILVKPPLKTVYLKNAVSEKVVYLELPSDQDCYSLKEDIKNGGVQFGAIEELTQKKKISRIISLSADSMEMGLMAVAYLAMHMLGRRDPFEGGELPFGLEYETSDAYWHESEMSIPVVSVMDITRYLNKDISPFDSGGFVMLQAQAKNDHQPFWRTCDREAVCLVVKRESMDRDWLDAVDLFSKNRNVYVLFLEEKESEMVLADELPFDELPFGEMDASHFRALRNHFVLSYASDLVEVTLDDKDAMAYYKNVLKQNIRQRGIKVKRGFSYERVVNLAGSVTRKSICEMLDKIINYALKDIEETENVVFGNDSFDFIDHFMREQSGAEEGKKGRELMEKNLVGLDDIKRQVYDVVNVMKYNQLRKQKNIGESGYHNVHVMLGAPGTAKTTVARYMGQMMFDEKLLTDNRFICINGAELKGMYVGHSAPKTKALFEKYDVIIIDEAYSIVEADGRTDSFGNEAIAQLIIELERHSMDKLVIFAGYGGKDVTEKDNRMQAFLDANPGIKSRITSTFYFKSYSAEEMAEIFLRIAKIGSYTLQDGTCELVREFFEKRVHDSDFGNGREARVLLENTVLFAARRIMEENRTDYTAEELKILTLEDVKAARDKMRQSFGIKSGKPRQVGFTHSTP